MKSTNMATRISRNGTVHTDAPALVITEGDIYTHPDAFSAHQAARELQRNGITAHVINGAGISVKVYDS